MGLMNKGEIDQQYDQLIDIIKETFSDDTDLGKSRVDGLLKMYSDYEERIKTAPASGKLNFHNAREGGYLDHILRVIDISKFMTKFFIKMGGYVDFTSEELIFAAMHHDLGKLGTLDAPYYVPQDSEWHKKNKLEIYKHNELRQYMKTSDLTFFILQSYGIRMTQKEMIGIKLTDGLYDKSNEDYLKQYGAGPLPLHTVLHKILHWSDHMAATIENDEFRKAWLRVDE